MRVHLNVLLSVSIIVGLLSACNSIDDTANNSLTKSQSIDENKVSLNNRSYYIATPKENFDLKKSYKLLLAFHGSRQKAKEMQGMASLESVSGNYIVVYPQSKVEEWNEGCDCNKPHRLGIDDLSFVEDVVADVKSKYNIIDKELYAVGFSQGGLFTQNLMCNSQLTFNGVASVASPMSEQLSKKCHIENNTNYLMVHGENDSTLPFKGLVHSNFGLISSEAAIDLIAKENDIDTSVVLEKNGSISKYIYKNDTHINQLIAIEGGGHNWSFNEFDTTKQVVKFFDSVSSNKLDTHSSLYRIGEQEDNDVHVRSMGLEHDGPAIILLSGFNKNYHSDSAWFSLMQPLIAKTSRVHVIERHGNGFSSLIEQPSYASFASVLDKTLAKLDEEEFIVVSFASANILAHTWQNLPNSDVVDRLKGMVWIDPDVLLPHSIILYQDWPVSWYRKVGDKLIDHIEQGNWTAKTIDKLTDERTIVEGLIPPVYKNDMDWSYFDLVSQSRTGIEKQLNRAKEIMNYHDDLNIAQGIAISTLVPITVIDTDFESHDIENSEAEYVDALSLWQQEGSHWSKLISNKSGGEYIPLANSEHLAVFQHPDVIIKAISNLKSK